MKRFGIRITLTESNPLRQPHLLGDDWAGIRWYNTENERDLALTDIQRQLPNYRIGDVPAQVLTKITES